MTGDPTPARHRRALLDNPADPLALQHLGLQARDGGGWAHAVRLFTRAAHLHGDRSVLDRQVGGTVAAALNQAAVHLQNAAADKAAACLEPLARILPPDGDFARILGTVRLIQGRDDEARRLHEASQNRAARNEDTGLGVALRGIARHKADYDILGTVVIPVHRMADTIGRALDSVAAAVRFHREASGDPQAQVHICVVDDASPDDTVARALRWAREHPEQSVAVIANNRNRGAGRARNVGAAAAHGRYLWFLDADDYYFERHLFLTASALDRTPDAGFVRTGIHFEGIDQDVTPVWRTASENSYPCNLCVRRACHDLTGGFPEEAPFHPAVADDVAYSRVLHSLFGGLRLAEKTVHYSMGADNALARQRADMTGGATPRDRGPPDARFMAIEILTQRRLHALNAKRALIARTGGWSGPPLLTPDTPPPPPGDAATWIARGKEAIGAGQPDRALARFTRAASLEPGNATAWFELGLAANSLQRFDLVSRAFRAVVRILPEAAAARFNLGSMLFDRGACAPAASSLRLALALQPDHVNSLFLLGRTVRRLGRTATAAALLARGVRLDPARPELDAEYADTALELGDAVRAARHARRALLSNPALYDGHAALAGALEILNRPGEALVAWERAIVCNPGRGEGFTRRAVNLLARRWGPPPVPAAIGRPGRRLASTPLGRHGRFGNQLLQYGVLRLYAARHGLTLEVPGWPGRHLYGFDDPLPGPALPRLAEADVEAAIVASLRGGGATVPVDSDVTAYFCGDTSYLAPFKDEFRALFEPGPNLRPHADAVAGRLRAAGRTIVALHIRRGDFGWGPFWTAPESWYLRWLETVWPTLDQPALFVATDDPDCLRAFAAYRPLTSRDLGEPIAGAEFFTDFHALCRADLVAISNSTFSFVATMLNRDATGFVRPDRTRQSLVPYDPWSCAVLT